MTQAGSVLVVDDQADRAAALVAALDDPHHRYEITPEAPDIEAVLGPDSPWDCVICMWNYSMCLGPLCAV